jgi:hypothetical protein
VLGLVAARRIEPPEAGARLALPFAVFCAVLGALLSFKRLPDAPTCRIPWILGGCGGESTIRDTDGNSRPKRPCWGHPGGKPKRLVNIAVWAGIYVALGLAVVVAVLVKRGA